MENEVFNLKLERELHLVKLDFLFKQCEEEALGVTRRDCEKALRATESDFLTSMKVLRSAVRPRLWRRFGNIFKRKSMS
jgi:hypothetical protein